MQISDATYARFVRLISDMTGIQLGENRRQMLRNRIAGRVRQLKLNSYDEYYDLLRSGDKTEEMKILIDVVTTNYTSFFRDPAQFNHLQSILEGLFRSGQPKIRIWSAACSTGEEVYSIAMTACLAAEKCRADIDRVRILATDISQTVLRRAFRGIYPTERIKNISPQYRRFFKPHEGTDEPEPGPHVRIDSELRGITIFRRVNLCEKPLTVPSGIDIIFIRNVLLYFDPQMVRQILGECRNKLTRTGFLYVGASESVSEYLENMETARPCVYRPRGANLLSAGAANASSTMEAVNA